MIYAIKIWDNPLNEDDYRIYKTTFYHVIWEVIQQQIAECEWFETFVTYDDTL